MLLAMIMLAVMLAIVAWVVIRTLRVPKKPEHERSPETLRDPASTAYQGGGDFGGFG